MDDDDNSPVVAAKSTQSLGALAPLAGTGISNKPATFAKESTHKTHHRWRAGMTEEQFEKRKQELRHEIHERHHRVHVEKKKAELKKLKYHAQTEEEKHRHEEHKQRIDELEYEIAKKEAHIDILKANGFKDSVIHSEHGGTSSAGPQLQIEDGSKSPIAAGALAAGALSPMIISQPGGVSLPATPMVVIQPMEIVPQIGVEDPKEAAVEVPAATAEVPAAAAEPAAATAEPAEPASKGTADVVDPDQVQLEAASSVDVVDPDGQA
jgi:hypothetical protein